MSKLSEVEGYRRLAVAILAQAARDARGKNGERAAALEWLLSDDCAALCEGLDYDHDRVRTWAKSTLEGLLHPCGDRT